MWSGNTSTTRPDAEGGRRCRVVMLYGDIEDQGSLARGGKGIEDAEWLEKTELGEVVGGWHAGTTEELAG